jgi:hypothetical protein
MEMCYYYLPNNCIDNNKSNCCCGLIFVCQMDAAADRNGRVLERKYLLSTVLSESGLLYCTVFRGMHVLLLLPYSNVQLVQYSTKLNTPYCIG